MKVDVAGTIETFVLTPNSQGYPKCAPHLPIYLRPVPSGSVDVFL